MSFSELIRRIRRHPHFGLVGAFIVTVLGVALGAGVALLTPVPDGAVLLTVAITAVWVWCV